MDTRFCPVCGESYAGDQETCPSDSARLVVLTAGADDLVGTTLDGRYEVRELLGSGGMGKVYRAYHALMDRDCAIKVLHPRLAADQDAVQRMLREARSISRLVHPNIVSVFDLGQTRKGLLYMVMEFLEGRCVRDALEQDGPLSPPRAIRVMLQLCDALSLAHAADIIHRDLKPENVFLEGNDDTVKVLDFGVAKVQSPVNMTQTGTIIGSPSYMSPEQARQDRVDARSDIYSMGLLLYEMLTGEICFDGNPMEALLKQLSQEAPKLPADVAKKLPHSLVALLYSMLDKDPDARPASCGVLREALEQAVEELGGDPDTVDFGPPPPLRDMVLRPKNIPLRHVSTGQPLVLVSANIAEGVIRALEGTLPSLGARVPLTVDVPKLTEVEIVIEVFDHSDDLARVRWIRVRAPSVTKLTDGIHDLVGEVVHVGAIDENALLPGRKLSWDPDTGEVSVVHSPRRETPGRHRIITPPKGLYKDRTDWSTQQLKDLQDSPWGDGKKSNGGS